MTDDLNNSSTIRRLQLLDISIGNIQNTGLLQSDTVRLMVFKRGNVYITRSLDGHAGGVWKMADSVKILAARKQELELTKPT